MLHCSKVTDKAGHYCNNGAKSMRAALTLGMDYPITLKLGSL